MWPQVVRFFNLLLAGLLVGAMFGIWLGFNPADLSPGAYVEQQQIAIRAMNVSMPVLGGVVILLTLASAVLARSHRRGLIFLISACVCFVASGLITRFLNQPINAVVMTWSASAPPPNWTELRDTWWQRHLLRTVIGIVGFCLLIVGNLILAPQQAEKMSVADDRHTPIAIVGAGFSGLGMAIALKRAGFDFTIFERRNDIGGTWLENTYPGCQCDVPSHLYSFSFALNPDWSHNYSFQPEIWQYLKQVAQRYDVLRHVRFDHPIHESSWDDARKHWKLETSHGLWTADVLISGAGALSIPAIPSLPGMENFRGKAFHSAEWDHSYDLTGKRVAVIGTGSSAIQFVPRIQPQVRQLYIYQRTPSWILPHTDRPIKDWERSLYQRFPALQRLQRTRVYWTQEILSMAFTKFPRLAKGIARTGRKLLAQQVPDEKLRRRLTPHYDPGCKRILISNDFYPAMSAANVELVTDEIREVRAHSIITADGQEREVDAILFGTGFKVTDNPMGQHVRGRNGQSLTEAWAETGAQAYLGTTVPGFPNLILMTGPNTGIGHTSLVVMIEAQLGYIVDGLRCLKKRGLNTFEVRREPFQRFNDDLQKKMSRTIWKVGGCNSWYLDHRGRNTTLWPDFTWKYCLRMRRFDAENYVLE